MAAGSIALTGFGLDSAIEVLATVAFGRLRAEARGGGSALRLVALTFFC